MLIRDRYWGISSKWRFSNEKFIENTTNGIYIAAAIGYFARRLLGGKVLCRANYVPGTSHRCTDIRKCTGDSKIHYLNIARISDHDIPGFDIPVNDSFAMGIFKCLQNARSDFKGAINTYLFITLQ